MFARKNAVVEGLVGDTLLVELALYILMPVQAELGVIREVGAELQKEGTKVLVHTIEVVMIHQGGGLHDPGVVLAGPGIAASLGSVDSALLLRLADEDNPFLLRKAGAESCRSFLRCPFSKQIIGMALSCTNFSIAATNARVMGSTNRVEATL